MADLKTHLLELSPLLAFGNLTYDISDISPQSFVKHIKNLSSTPLQFPENIMLKKSFTPEEGIILEKGYVLGKRLIEKFKFFPPYQIIWTGNNTQNTMPIDLIINDILFSLKEESFILENMGLYKLISLITGKNTERGSSHIFNDFSKEEYNNWFNYSWNYLLMNNKFWTKAGNSYNSSITVDNESVILKFNEKSVSLPAILNLGIDKFSNFTTSEVREKTFSKWVKENLENNEEYLKYKRTCAITAGENLTNYLRMNMNCSNSNILRLLQIYPKSYYYAKAKMPQPEIFRIPDVQEYAYTIEIKDIKYSVPRSQLNLITTIQNKKTLKNLILRNEIRFSHGQFNGTPEAKMYYDNSSDLSTIYLPL